MRRYLAPLAVLGTLACLAWTPAAPSTVAAASAEGRTSAPADLTPTPYQREVAGIVAGMLETFHYRRLPVDDALSAVWLDTYLDTLDGARNVFLQSDIDEFQAFRTQLDDDLIAQPPRIDRGIQIYQRYRVRLSERAAYAKTVVAAPVDLTNNESFVADRKEAGLPWPATTAEANDLWRQGIEDEVIGALLAERDDEAEIRRVLSKRYDRLVKTVSEFESDDVLEYWLGALARSYDPHSMWMKPASNDDFDIDITNSVEGIGASLRPSEDFEFTTVAEVIAGGPASKDGRLQYGDKILAVAQGDAEPVDVVGWPLDEVVKLIRGAKGTEVRLLVRPADAEATEQVITLIRDRVTLESSAAQGRLETVGGHKLGVVELPSFYFDPLGRKNGRRASADMQRVIEDLETQGVEGILLDLRGNGGGSLIEAIDVAGLFLPGGPVVLVRGRDGRIEAMHDEDSGVAWSGPLVVMTDATSASASEIVAGVLQDYGRAVIVGDKSTHGKGTVQQLTGLTQQLRGSHQEDVGGTLKLTLQKFYRVSGGSTQNKGVEADVVLPSRWDGAEVYESDLPNALPWDQIPPAPHAKVGDPSEVIGELRARSATRVSADEDFQWLQRSLAEQARFRARPATSLVLETRKAELEAYKKFVDAPEQEELDEEVLQAMTQAERKERRRTMDFSLDEALLVLQDYIALGS